MAYAYYNTLFNLIIFKPLFQKVEKYNFEQSTGDIMATFYDLFRLISKYILKSNILLRL